MDQNRNDLIMIFLALSIHTLSEKPHFLCLIMIYRFAYHIFARQIACGNVIFTHFLLMLQSSFGFIDYFDCRSAAQAILSLNGKQLLSILGLCMLISVNTLLLLALNAKDSPQNQVWSANKCQLGIYKYSEGGHIRFGTE